MRFNSLLYPLLLFNGRRCRGNVGFRVLTIENLYDRASKDFHFPFVKFQRHFIFLVIDIQDNTNDAGLREHFVILLQRRH